jgi:predicted DNA-binding ArsR family transcriptional regulator
MHDDISGIADKAEGDVKEIADQAEMGQKTRDSVKEYVAKIEKLIKNLEDGVVDEDEDD